MMREKENFFENFSEEKRKIKNMKGVFVIECCSLSL
jgi:hypothetical protein